MSEQRRAVRLHVLLVEDDVEAREIYASCLRDAGYEVIEAATLHEASEAFVARRPDVIILDRNLPDGDGLALARKWRRSSTSPPIVMVTASGERSDVHAALFAECDAFLTKPCPGDVLLLHIERALVAATPPRRLAAVGARSEPPPSDAR